MPSYKSQTEITVQNTKAVSVWKQKEHNNQNQQNIPRDHLGGKHLLSTPQMSAQGDLKESSQTINGN